MTSVYSGGKAEGILIANESEEEVGGGEVGKVVRCEILHLFQRQSAEGRDVTGFSANLH